MPAPERILATIMKHVEGGVRALLPACRRAQLAAALRTLTPLALLPFGACNVEAPLGNSQGEAVAEAEEGLWTTTLDGPHSYWPGGVIPVCITPGGAFTPSTPIYVTKMAAAQTIAEAEYEHIPHTHIDFTGWG